MKQVIQLDENNYYVGVTFADESPLEPGVFLFPSGTIDTSVPIIPDGKKAKWNDGWVFEDLEIIEEESLIEFTYKDNRAIEYPPITDYLDGIVKGDQEQIDAYIAACQAVKTKYPKPE